MGHPHAHGEGHTVIELQTDGEHDGDFIVVGEGGNWVDDHGKGNVVFIGDNKISLRCPEGDTTMRVEKAEVEDVFLCPKHSVPLEKVESKARVHEIKVRKKEEPKDY
jgi:hypothetical protein